MDTLLKSRIIAMAKLELLKNPQLTHEQATGQAITNMIAEFPSDADRIYATVKEYTGIDFFTKQFVNNVVIQLCKDNTLTVNHMSYENKIDGDYYCTINVCKGPVKILVMLWVLHDGRGVFITQCDEQTGQKKAQTFVRLVDDAVTEIHNFVNLSYSKIPQ